MCEVSKFEYGDFNENSHSSWLRGATQTMAVYPKQLPPAYKKCDLMGEGLLSVKDAMMFLGVCRQTVYNLMDNGRLPFVIVEGLRGRRIPRTVLRIFAELM